MMQKPLISAVPW